MILMQKGPSQMNFSPFDFDLDVYSILYCVRLWGNWNAV